MKGKNQSFSFLMELIIVIFFFALATTVCISFLVKAKEKQMDGVIIQNAMLEMQSMIETMQAYPQTPLEQLFKVEKIDANTYQKENIKIVVWEDQIKHGVISIFNQDDVICETPFVLGGTSHD